jgi:hypothetical protein
LRFLSGGVKGMTIWASELQEDKIEAEGRWRQFIWTGLDVSLRHQGLDIRNQQKCHQNQKEGR